MSTKIRFMNFVAFLLNNEVQISIAYDHIAKLFYVKHRLFFNEVRSLVVTYWNRPLFAGGGLLDAMRPYRMC